MAGSRSVAKPLPGGPTGRPSLAPPRSKVAPKPEVNARRQTTTALNDRTNTRSVTGPFRGVFNVT